MRAADFQKCDWWGTVELVRSNLISTPTPLPMHAHGFLFLFVFFLFICELVEERYVVGRGLEICVAGLILASASDSVRC